MIIIFQIIFGLSVAGILILAFRKIPVLLNYPRHPFEEISLKQKLLNKWKDLKGVAGQSNVLHNSIIPNTEKALRKTKVFVLKFDNLLAKLAGKIKRKKQEKEENDNENETPR